MTAEAKKAEACCAADVKFDVKKVLDVVAEQLASQGIDLEAACCGGQGVPNLKVVCVAPTLRQSAEELGKTSRDHVVMVRVDESTAKKLDAWVETGAVKSRSEAAALFIREGLRMRDAELSRLHDALRDVENARRKLREQAQEVFGNGGHA